jgi:Uncharacterised protein family UPF0047
MRTGTRLVTDITNELHQFCRDRGDGLCHVFVPHATAGVALIETGSGSESDLQDSIDRLLPAQNIYRHRHGSSGHGRDHVLPAFVSPSLSSPYLAAARRSVPGRAWYWSTRTSTTPTGWCASASFPVDAFTASLPRPFGGGGFATMQQVLGRNDMTSVGPGVVR